MLSPCIESSFPLHPQQIEKTGQTPDKTKRLFKLIKTQGFGKAQELLKMKKKNPSTLSISYQSMHPSNPIRLESQQETIPLFTIMSLSIHIGPFKPLLFTIISGFLSNAERDFVLEPPGGNLISITFSGFVRMF